MHASAAIKYGNSVVMQGRNPTNVSLTVTFELQMLYLPVSL